MLFSRTIRIAALGVVALIGTASLALATSYAAQQDYPNRSGEYEQAYVTSNVNVRSGPGQNNRVVNRLRRGDFVNVGECRSTWCFVDVFGGNGWVSGRFIGRGENPYQSRGPAGPGIPPQEPGTRY
ncbi:SH3 domain-containing protein [Aureimonas altamirensis]|uniref:SH3 domain-containing protein n=1 Tax=Aureimonas altamirensis TaxID=370622 RepID=UPI001E2E5CBB|nr:SH3 domain-containing protein [Aureimonas altamirensis]UHD46403.1 SH3 domain-containing protein [Aureimonas altamirensis]